MGKEEEAGEESEEEQEADSDGEPPDKPHLAYMHENVAETTVAVDPVHHVGPVRMMQALQGTLQALQQQAARIAQNEKTPTVADSSGALQPVVDEGGRHTMRTIGFQPRNTMLNNRAYHQTRKVHREAHKAHSHT